MSKRLYLAAATIALAAGCAGSGMMATTAGDQHFSADIRRTAYGVPHIKANDFGGLGYGFGYASAQDNICEILDRMMTVTATRARYLGPGDKDANINSDVYHQRMIDSGETEKLLAGPASSIDTPSADARALAKGYVAGINRYIRDTGASGITDPRCKGQPWVHEIREIDFWRHMFVGQTVDAFIAPTSTAAPPGASNGALPDDGDQHAALERRADDPLEDTELGSNAYGLGREVTQAGGGMVLGNPHYPWTGPNRFYRAHLMIPGKLNVDGVSYVGMPLIRMGHTATIAWSNTVSTARRYGYYELKLDPADPTKYLYEGKSVPMERRTVTVQVKRGDTLVPETRTLYASRWGVLTSSRTFPWSKDTAYALRTVRVGLRDLDQYMTVWQAKDVHQLLATLNKYQAYRFNTTAADAGGETLYGDFGMIPNVSEKLAAECAVSDLARQQWKKERYPVLDGSRAACDWKTDADSSSPGVFGASAAPHLMRTDYVTQSNDSYWLTNPNQPLEGYSRIWGDERTARSLRTRLGLDQVQKRVAGADGLPGRKFDLATLQQVMFGDRHLGGEMARDDLVTLCRLSGRPKLLPACEALARWDLHVNLDSRGAHLFHLFADNKGLKWKVPFNPADPVHTPNTLDIADPSVLDALEKAVDRLNELNIPLDARLGDVQAQVENGERIPMHGGDGPEGVFNVVTVEKAMSPKLGWTRVRTGASWIMTVEFKPGGPVSQGLLTYSESLDPTSPHHTDQTKLFSAKGWDDLRFTEAAVEQGTVSRQTISQ